MYFLFNYVLVSTKKEFDVCNKIVLDCLVANDYDLISLE